MEKIWRSYTIMQKKRDIKFSQADISLAKKELKYLPKFGLKDIKNIF